MTKKTILQKIEQDYPEKVKDAYIKALEEELRSITAKLESQIEKMKCVENCKNSRNRDKCFTDYCPCKNWELK